MGAITSSLLAALLVALPVAAAERTTGADFKLVSDVTAIQPGVVKAAMTWSTP